MLVHKNTRVSLLRDLPQKIRDGKAIISVVGMGRVGLPLALVLARSGLRVIGVDVDTQRVSSLNNGEMPFHYPAIRVWLKEALKAKLFTSTSDSKRAIEECDVIVLTVGTPTGEQNQIDYSQLHAALAEVTSTSLRGKALILRSTSVPGTIKRIVMPMLSNKSLSTVGVDFALAACPERILEGQAHKELYELPEIIGAEDTLSATIASELFRKISKDKKILVTTPTGAELAKLFTNIYRYVNFALANEFAIWAERYGEDAHEIIRVANENYVRSKIPRPGFAGGPCLSKDGMLLDNGTTFSSIISAAWKLNEAVPQHVVMALLNEFGTLYGMKLAVLGLSFKADSDDLRLSPSVKLVELLKAYGAIVKVHEPHVPDSLGLEQALQGSDVVILATNHTAFTSLAPTIEASGCVLVYDVWGMFDPKDFVHTRYRRFGRAA